MVVTVPASRNEYIIYPEGCEELTGPPMSMEELIRRATAIATALQNMAPEENLKKRDKMIPLFVYFTDEFFLEYPNKELRLLIACCIADGFRIFAPACPYRNSEIITTVFEFFIEQLDGVENPAGPAFSRYFYLMENLSVVKTFGHCYDLETPDLVLTQLFAKMYKIVNEKHSLRIQSLMVDFLAPLISQAPPPSISRELMSAVLKPILRGPEVRPQGYKLASSLISLCSDALEKDLNFYVNEALIGHKSPPPDLIIYQKTFKVIHEVYKICPQLILGVFPYLEFKVKSLEEKDRMGSIRILADVFSEERSTLAKDFPELWEAFLGRFNDISVPIRVHCVKSMVRFFLHHDELRADLLETLKNIVLNDAEEEIRFEAVKAIIAVGQADLSVILETEDLQAFLEERTEDLKFKIRREALQGLADLYKMTVGNLDSIPRELKDGVRWLQRTILDSYLTDNLQDQIVVERFLNTRLVSYKTESEERMTRLFFLYVGLDESSARGFLRTQTNHRLIREHLRELYRLVMASTTNNLQATHPKYSIEITRLVKFLPDTVKAAEFLHKFARQLKEDNNLAQNMEKFLNPGSCAEVVKSTNAVVQKLGKQAPSNRYYNTIKVLLERSASVLVDTESVQQLLNILHGVAIECEDLLWKFDLRRDTGLEKTVGLLRVLTFVYAREFCNESSVSMVIGLLEFLPEVLRPSLLNCLVRISTEKRICFYTDQSNLLDVLIPACKRMILEGTSKEAKWSIRLMVMNLLKEIRIPFFTDIIQTLRANLSSPTNEHFETSIVALGYIALLLPEEFRTDMRDIMKSLVKNLILKPTRSKADGRKNAGDWCKFTALPDITRAVIGAMKAVMRWASGLKTDLAVGVKLFKLMFCIVESGGKEFEPKDAPYSDCENNWLRASAGTAILLLCRQKGVGDQYTPLQLATLSTLMVDEVPEIREKFVRKLYRGFVRGPPITWYPMDFLGMFVLAGYESLRGRRAVVRKLLQEILNIRFRHTKELKMMKTKRAIRSLPHFTSQYLPIFLISFLCVRNPRFNSYTNLKELEGVKDCLSFVLELLIKQDDYSFGFTKKLVEDIKGSTNLILPGDQEVDNKIYAACDLVITILLQKSPKLDTTVPSSVLYPRQYFKYMDDPNLKSYLPPSMQYVKPRENQKVVTPVVPLVAQQQQESEDDESASDTDHPAQETTPVMQARKTPRPRVMLPKRLGLLRTREMDRTIIEEEEEEDGAAAGPSQPKKRRPQTPMPGKRTPNPPKKK